MAIELRYDEKQGLILGKVSGDFNSNVAKKVAEKLAGLIKTTGCNKLLNDLTKTNITPSTIDIYKIPRIVNETGVPIVCRRAILVGKSFEDFHFLETASVNLGQQTKMFTDLNEALKWLNS